MTDDITTVSASSPREDVTCTTSRASNILILNIFGKQNTLYCTDVKLLLSLRDKKK
jgi:hypothetical protein